MSREQILAREAKWGRIAGVLGLAGVLLFLSTLFGAVGADYNAIDELQDRLDAFAEFRDEVLIGRIMVAAAALLFAAPLFFLFKAAQARSPQMMGNLAVLTLIGPLMLATAFILGFFGTEAAAEQFVANPTPLEEFEPTRSLEFAVVGAFAGVTEGLVEGYAEDVMAEQGANNSGAILTLVGVFLIALMTFYSSLYGMRTGLLSRFTGVLGMSFGVASILFGLPMLILVFGMISLLVANFWFGDRPPAWDAGKAIPWPDPRAPAQSTPEQAASPEDFYDPDAEDADGADDSDSAGRPGRRDNRRKRKRKQRR